MTDASRHLLLPAWAALVASLLMGSSSEGPLAGVDPMDAKGLLEAGIRFEDQGSASLAIQFPRQIGFGQSIPKETK